MYNLSFLFFIFIACNVFDNGVPMQQHNKHNQGEKGKEDSQVFFTVVPFKVIGIGYGIGYGIGE